MAFVVLYDSCVLYPAPLRDLLLRVALTGVVRARWSEKILEECFRSILQDRPDLDEKALARTRDLMRVVVPDCIVDGYQDLVESLELPDPNDRHVLAAAIHSGAQAIVTFNLRDFPEERLRPYAVEAKHPDDFIQESLDIAPADIAQVVLEQAAALKNPPRSVWELLDTLRDQGLPTSVARLRGMIPSQAR